MNLYLSAKLLLSLVAIAQGLGPITADFNQTHATNPAWTAHARFHVVWQVLAQTGVSLCILLLLWAFPSPLHTWMAAGLALNWVVTFFVTLVSMPLFEGSLTDQNGIKPFRFSIPGRVLEVDTNLFGASMLGSLSLLAVLFLFLF
jgi:hypothetical protein